MKKTIYTLAAAVLASSFAFAQDSTKTGKFTVSGYIDSYYNYSLNNPQSGSIAGDPTSYTGDANTLGLARGFDRSHNQFSLGLVQTKFAYTNRNSEMVIDLVYGPNAALANFGNAVGLTPFIHTNASGASNATYASSIAIKQAYFKYNVTSKFSFTVGQFGTHIGYEVIDAPLNYNYSLSNLFNNGPFYHVGAKLNYAFSDKFGLMFGVVNNWDNLYDFKSQKSLVAQIFVSPAKGWNVYANWIGGANDDGYKFPKAGLPSGIVGGLSFPVNTNYTRNLFDLTTGYQVSSKLYLGMNAAYGWYSFNEDVRVSTPKPTDDLDGDGTPDAGPLISSWFGSLTPNWWGIAGYANFQFTSFLGLGVRYEHFNDKNAVRYIQTINNSFTVTMPITLADGHLILKPEFRMDNTTGRPIYESSDPSAPTRSQNVFGMAFIYKY
ncbi:MAG: porin [Bacteroidetes bacterium]|nr:MAG: porin [Bacteroidota bacterium]